MSKYTVNKNIKHYLKLQNITQTDFAHTLNLPITTVNSWLRCCRRVPTELITNICEFLNVTPNDLFSVNTTSSLNTTNMLFFYKQLSETQQIIVIEELKTLCNYSKQAQFAARTDTINNNKTDTDTNIDICVLENADNKADTLD